MSGKPFCVVGGECIGNVPTIDDLAFYIKDYIKSEVYGVSWGTDEVNSATRKQLYDKIEVVVAYILGMGLGDLVDKDHSNLTNVLENQHHPKQHELDGGDHLLTQGLGWDKVDKVGSDINQFDYRFHSDLQNIGGSDHHVKTVSSEISLAGLLEKAHASLTGVSANQHHTQAHTLASHSTKAHSELTGINPSDHHVKTVSGDISLASLLEKSHASLSGVSTSQHHVKTVSNEISLAGLLEKSHVSLSGVLTSQHHVKTVSNEISLANLLEKSYNNLTDKPTVLEGIGIESDNIIHSNDTEKNTNSLTYVKLKELTCYKNLKGVRLSVEMRTDVSMQTVNGKICVNDVIVGTEFETADSIYTVFYRDSSLKNGDTIQFYGKVSFEAGFYCYIQNMKIKYSEFVNNDPV